MCCLSTKRPMATGGKVREALNFATPASQHIWMAALFWGIAGTAYYRRRPVTLSVGWALWGKESPCNRSRRPRLVGRRRRHGEKVAGCSRRRGAPGNRTGSPAGWVLAGHWAPRSRTTALLARNSGRQLTKAPTKRVCSRYRPHPWTRPCRLPAHVSADAARGGRAGGRLVRSQGMYTGIPDVDG